MKRLFLILLVLLLLLAGAWFAPRLLDDPGYVMIDIAGWRLEASLLVLVASVAGAWLALWLLIALLRLPGRSVRATRDAWQRRQLENGLLALTEGDWPRAEKALARALKGHHSTAGYLAAARAAQGQARLEHRDQYLDKADRPFGRRHFITGLARARLLSAEGQVAEAIPVLEDLHVRKPRHAGVLRLLLHAYQDQGRWRDVRLLVRSLRRAGVVDRAGGEKLGALAARHELEDALDVRDLEQAWSDLPRRVRLTRDAVLAYARRAIALGRPELAETELRRALEREWHPDLVHLYADSDPDGIAQRIHHCQRWQRQHGDDADLLLTLGDLHQQARAFDEARACLERSLQQQPSARGYELLGRVMDKTGDLEGSARCYRNALRLQRGRPVEPLSLPMPPAP